VGGTQVPRVVTGSQDPKGHLGAVLPVCGPLVSYVPDGDYSDRTNPADLCSTHREPTVVCPSASEPTEALLRNNRPVQNLRFPAAGATTPCRLNKS
jgi:hypothetical protein